MNPSHFAPLSFFAQPILLACLAGLSLSTSLLHAQKALRDIPSTKVEDQSAAFKLLEGAQINLFAAEPLLKKPVHMNWDSQGRLWVVNSPLYPHIKPGQEESDQIIVLEDTDGDGTADKSTVFADNLHIPTAVLPGDGGAYVANSTEMLFLQDTDGDGKADHRRIVLSGFGTEDTHHLIHTFRWGPEGMIWMNQSIYIHTHLETPYGIRRLLGGGMWHFRPETQRAEVFMKGLVNPWGHIFDREGQSFMTDGAGGQGINFVFPRSVFMTSPGASRILTGLNPGQPKHCGLEILSGDHIPEALRDLLAAPDFRGHRINLFKLSENTSSAFASVQHADLVGSTHRAFRPIDVKMGPDGAIYIADWYNPIIQHGEVDFRDPRRDHERGRIWRVSFKDRPLDKPANFNQLSDEELVRLAGPTGWNSQMATVELRQRDKEKALAATRSAWQKETSETRKLHLVMASQAINRFQPEWAVELATQSTSPQVRAGALRALYYEAPTHGKAYETARKAVSDPHPRVRLWGVSLLAQLPHADTVQIALEALDGIDSPDDYLDFAVWSLCREHAHKWQPLATTGNPFKTPAQLLYAMIAQNTSAGSAQILEALDQGGFKTDREITKISDWAARSGDATVLGRIYRKALAPETASLQKVKLLNALSSAMKQRKLQPEGDLAAITGLLSSDQAEVYREAASLAGLWKIAPARAELEKVFLGSDSPRSDAALEALRLFGGGETAQFLAKLAVDTAQTAAQRVRAIEALARIDSALASKLAVSLLPTMDNTDLAGRIFAAFLSNNQATAQLADALKGVTLPQPVASAGLQKAASAATKPEALLAAIQSAGNLKPMKMSLDPQEMEAMIQTVTTKGDPVRGEKIYRRASLQCIVCHAIAGSGGLVGPDLISIGSSAPIDYLIESLLEPGKKIKEGYHTTLVTLKNGDTFAGAVAREDATELVIRDATGKENRLIKNQISSQIVSPVSLMPPGLTLQLRQDEFADLVRFLSELGKEGVFKVSPRPFLRKWEVLHPHERTRDEIGHYGNKIFAEDFKGYQWTPFFARVDGFLPLDEVPDLQGRGKNAFGVFRLQFNASAATQLKLSIEGKRNDLTLFLNETEIPLPENASQSYEVNVPVEAPGTHRLSVVGLKGYGLDQVRVEVIDANKVTFDRAD